MPKKMFPYNQRGREGTSPWLWAWDVPTSKGTGTPYIVSVRPDFDALSAMWGCNCAAGKSGHPSCQHRMRVQYEIVTVSGMLANLPLKVRELVAPDFAAVQPKQNYSAPTARELTQSDDRRLKVVI